MQWATLRIQRGQKELDTLPAHLPNGEWICIVTVFLLVGIYKEFNAIYK